MLRDNLDYYIEELINNTKGKYITHTVSYDKTNPSHISLLKLILQNSRNISAFYRESAEMRLNSDNSQGYNVKFPKKLAEIEPEKQQIKSNPIPKQEVSAPPQKETIRFTLDDAKPKENQGDSSSNISGFCM